MNGFVLGSNRYPVYGFSKEWIVKANTKNKRFYQLSYADQWDSGTDFNLLH